MTQKLRTPQRTKGVRDYETTTKAHDDSFDNAETGLNTSTLVNITVNPNHKVLKIIYEYILYGIEGKKIELPESDITVTLTDTEAESGSNNEENQENEDIITITDID